MLFNLGRGQRSFLTTPGIIDATKKEQRLRILNERLSFIACSRALLFRRGRSIIRLIKVSCPIGGTSAFKRTAHYKVVCVQVGSPSTNQQRFAANAVGRSIVATVVLYYRVDRPRQRALGAPQLMCPQPCAQARANLRPRFLSRELSNPCLAARICHSGSELEKF
jgi:hypothetical protein